LKNTRGINTILAALLMVVIVVVASVMVYAWSTGLLGTLLVQPNVGKEALTMDTYAFPTPTTPPNSNVTLTLRNAGTVAITFASYYVKNATGTTFTQPTWTSGPTIQPNNPGLANIGVGCTGCGSFSTSSFTFVSGNSYTVTLVTSRNNQFTFTVTR
jgi:hypothetical protein